jgi:hypothetical protein
MRGHMTNYQGTTMNADELRAHLATMERLKTELEHVSHDVDEWVIGADKDAREGMRTGVLLLRARSLGRDLMRELLKATIEASELRLLTPREATMGEDGAMH